jgi:hypothetical protein
MKKILILAGLITVFSTHSSYSQKMGPIQLDRPDQTETPSIVPAGYIQAENGFLMENETKDGQNYTYPSCLWKYGINERVELRLITEFASMKDKVNNKTTSGLMPITVGFKANICQEKGIIPHTSFIGHLTTANIGSEELRTAYAAPSFRFLMAHNVTDRFSISYNLGAEWNGETPEESYLYTFATGYAITDKLGMYAELYGFAPRSSKAWHGFDGGFTYLVNNDIMIDLSGGFGVTENAPDNYIAFGFSYRFRMAGKKMAK